MKKSIVWLLITWFFFQRNLTSSRMVEDVKYYNVGVLMVSHLNSPFDLERCGPAVDMALEEINEKFLVQHKIALRKVQGR